MERMHEFAVEWCDKFRNSENNSLELVDHNMADDCVALGFEMDCGHAFSEKYGQAVEDSAELAKIINQVEDRSLLGSAIYSRWSYFMHGASGSAEILEPNNREWFIAALVRLASLTAAHIDTECTIILFPEFATLKTEVEKLRTEISMLLLERDELRFVICKNIETAYILAFGGLEYRAFELHCELLRLKRKIELVQAKKNRQEKIILSAIEKVLDEEFAEYQRLLNEQINKMNKAIDQSKGSPLTDEETKEIKKLYRNIVKALHPDLHPEVSAAQIQLFHNAVEAYENGDLANLRIISEMVTEAVIPERNETGLAILVKEKERLTENLELIRGQIAEIKSEYPYTMKDMVNDPEQIAGKRAELEKTINELKKAYDAYAVRLKEMLR